MLNKKSFTGNTAPATTLPKAFGLWGVASSLRSTTLFWPNLPTLFPPDVRVALQHPLFDSAQLTLLGAWPVSSATQSYVLEFASDLATALVSGGTQLFNSSGSFGWACDGPLGAVSNDNTFFRVQIGNRSGTASFSMASFVAMGLDPTYATGGVHIDTCRNVQCNPSCPKTEN